MYSGDKVIYGVEVDTKMVCTIIVKHSSCYDVRDVFEFDRYELMDIFKEALGFEHIDLHSPACYNYKSRGELYIGVELGRNYIAYRDSIETFDSIQDYQEFFMRGFNRIMANMTPSKKNENEYDMELKKLFPTIKPKVYSMANDCETCT